jgi:hypothetical protein
VKISVALHKNLGFLYTVDKSVKCFLAQQEGNENPLLHICSNNKMSLLLTETSNSTQIKNSWSSMAIIVTRNHVSFSVYIFSSRRGPGFKSPEFGCTTVRSCNMSNFPEQYKEGTFSLITTDSLHITFSTLFSTHHSIQCCTVMAAVNKPQINNT